MKRAYPIVEVEWIDANSDGGWRPADAENDPVVCLSAGYLLAKTRAKVQVLQSYSESGDVTDSISIPAAWVRRITYLRRKKT